MQDDYDLVIVGGGPHALSLISRLLVNVPDKYEERPNNQKAFTAKRGESLAQVFPFFFLSDIIGCGTKQEKWPKSEKTWKSHGIFSEQFVDQQYF